MVPHVRYDPRFVADYFPGPDWWPAAARHVVEPGLLTSGVSNPPILPIAVKLAGERQPDTGRRDDLWRRSLPHLTAWLRWFADSRARRPGGMPVVVHPWEAGWDNSPRWDRLREARLRPTRAYLRRDTLHVGSDQRPSGRDYDAYVALAEQLDTADYDLETYLPQAPFAVHDVLIDALWHAAADDVNAMALALGEAPRFTEAELKAHALEFDAVHWDAVLETYLDRDVLTGEPIRVRSAAAPAALAGGFFERERAAEVWRGYAAAARGARLVCTVPPVAPEFEPARYWRGPVWLCVNWLVARGLALAGMLDEANRVRAESLQLVESGGFWEYFDALSGEGRGIEGFTWTAALVLDFLEA